MMLVLLIVTHLVADAAYRTTYYMGNTGTGINNFDSIPKQLHSIYKSSRLVSKQLMTASLFGGLFNTDKANADSTDSSNKKTNEIVQVVNGIAHKRLGGSDIVVSDMALGMYKPDCIYNLSTITSPSLAVQQQQARNVGSVVISTHQMKHYVISSWT